MCRLGGLSLVAAVVMLVGCSKPADTGRQPEPAPQPAPKQPKDVTPPQPKVIQPKDDVPPAQPKQPSDQGPIEITAEKWGKEVVEAPNSSTIDDKYRGKTVRVTGKVRTIYDNYVNLETGFNFKEGQVVNVVMVFPENANLKDLKAGMVVVIEGKFDRMGARGPACENCRLVKTQ